MIFRRFPLSGAWDTSHYPKDVPFDVPEGWAWCKIEEIAESNIGLTYKPEDVCSDGIPVLRSNNIKNRRICTDGLIRVKTHILPKQFIGKGDLLICARNGSRNLVGKCALIEQDEEPMSFGAFMAVCRSAFNRWIFLILNSSYFNQYLDNSNSTAINQVTQSMLLSFNIPLPPKNEQARIYSMIERLCSCVDELEKHEQVVLAKINDSRKRILELAIHGKLVPQDPTEEPAIELLKRINPAFEPSHNLHYEGELPNGWTLASMESFCTTINGLWKGDKEPLINVGVIRNANFTKDFSLDYSKIEYINVEERSFSKRNLEDGDIIVEKSGGSDNFPVGRSILYRGESGKYSFSNFTMSLRIKDKSHIIPEYLFYALQSMYRRGDMRQMQTQTTGLHNLLTDVFMSAQIPIPPSNEQKRIVTAIESHFQTLDSVRSLLQD